VVVAAACLGGAEKCIEIAADYAKQRKAFGRSLSKFQGISFDLADLYTQFRPAQEPVDERGLDDRQVYSEPGSFTQKQIKPDHSGMQVAGAATGGRGGQTGDNDIRCLRLYEGIAVRDGDERGDVVRLRSGRCGQHHEDNHCQRYLRQRVCRQVVMFL